MVNNLESERRELGIKVILPTGEVLIAVPVFEKFGSESVGASRIRLYKKFNDIEEKATVRPAELISYVKKELGIKDADIADAMKIELPTLATNKKRILERHYNRLRDFVLQKRIEVIDKKEKACKSEIKRIRNLLKPDA